MPERVYAADSVCRFFEVLFDSGPAFPVSNLDLRRRNPLTAKSISQSRTMGFQHVAFAAHTDIGRKRQRNEDAILALPEYGVFCVADGMGGIQGGEMASRAVVDALRQTLVRRDDRDATLESTRAQITRAIEEAGRAIRREAAERGFRGAGTTAVVLALDARDPARAAAFHAGDSRLYRFRGGILDQITRDHSFAAAVGYRDPSSLPSLFRNLVTRAIGLDDFVELEETSFEIQPRDLLLLCSDGLTNMLPDNRLAAILSAQPPDSLAGLPQVLVDQANQAGGVDNISVIAVRAGLPIPTAAGLG
jgi:protein phosphatase